MRARNAVGLEFGSAFAFRIWEALEPDSNGLACRDVDTSPCLSNGPHSGFITLVCLLLFCYNKPFFAFQIRRKKMPTILNMFNLDFPRLIIVLQADKPELVFELEETKTRN